MAKHDTRIKPGEHRSPETEFRPGQHWRERKPFWDREWLEREYVERQRSAADIATEWEVTEAAIFFWLRKHKIPRRSIVEARSVKHWGISGEANGMYGKRGDQVPNWKGGITPERQAFYSSAEWKVAARMVTERDRGICRRCGKGPLIGRDSQKHHIVPFTVKGRRADVDNIVTLCAKCHGFVHGKSNTTGEFLG